MGSSVLPLACCHILQIQSQVPTSGEPYLVPSLLLLLQNRTHYTFASYSTWGSLVILAHLQHPAWQILGTHYLWPALSLLAASQSASGCPDYQQPTRHVSVPTPAQDSRFGDGHAQPHWFRPQSYGSLALCQGSLLFQLICEFHKTITPAGKRHTRTI